MEEPKRNSLDATIASNQRTSSVIPDNNIPFITAEDMVDPPNLGYMAMGDPDAYSLIDYAATDIQKYSPSALANMAIPDPGLATDTYNPKAQQNPAQSLVDRIDSIRPVSEGPAADKVDPLYSGMRASNFMRYYEHPEFDNLGFTPYTNNEEFYNANSSIWDDMTRMVGQVDNLIGAGFSSVYRSWMDAGDTGYFTSPDLASAGEFENAMAIGNSTRGGVGGFTNNLLLNSGYTMGIISSIAVEEAFMFAGTAALGLTTGPGAAPAAAATTARTTYNVKRGYDAIKNLFGVGRAYTATRNMLRGLNNPNRARTFWGTTGRFAADFFAPDTVRAIKSLKSTQNGLQNISNMKKASTLFGGFYRDLRQLNYALAESKLEGGMNYNKVLRDNLNYAAAMNGGFGVSDEDARRAVNRASESSFYTAMANAPIIYVSNKLVLGNAFGGFNRSLGRVFRDSYKGLASRVIKTKPSFNKAGKKVKDVFSDSGGGLMGWLRKVRAGGVKGNAGMAAGATLRYFAANFGEGIQEVSQEAVNAATEGYFTSTYKDPISGGIDLRNQMILSGMGEQFSGQGFETFMSGFLMGGVVQVPQKLFFQGVPAVYQKIRNPKAYQEYQQNKQDYIDSVVKTYNDAWNNQVDDPSSIFDLTKLNLIIQKQSASGMKQSAYDSDMFGFTDAKDFAKFQQIYTLFNTNGTRHFKEQLNDFLKLSDEELSEAFPSSQKDVKNGKLRQRISDTLNSIDNLEESFQESKDRFENPYDQSKFKKGSRQYIQEALKQRAFEHARYLYMFTKDGFARAIERSESIFSRLQSDPLFKNMAASDITVLLDPESIDKELAMLLQEVSVQEGDTAESKKIRKQKLERIKRLGTFKAVLIDPANINKDGSFDKRKISKLRKEFRNYVRYMASSAGSFMDEASIDEALKDIVDYTALKGRAKTYDKAIEALINPKKFDEVVERQMQVNYQVYKNLQKNFKTIVNNYVDIVEANELMNQLDALGIYPDPQQAKEFLKTGNADVLKDFYSEEGMLMKGVDDLKLSEIAEKINVYIKATRPEQQQEEEEKQPDITPEEVVTNQDEVLQNAGVEVELTETSNTPMLNELLKRQYKNYAALQAQLGEKKLSYEDWVNSARGLGLKNTFNSLKKIWASAVVPVGLDAQRRPIFIEISEEDLKAEKGFKNWLNTREVRESDLVAQVLDLNNLKLEDIIEPVVSDAPQDSTRGKKGTSVYKAGAIVDVLKIETLDPQTQEKVAFFKLVDKNGNDLSPLLLDLVGNNLGSYSSAASAIDAMKKIDRTAPNSASFVFDTVELHQGASVYNKDNKEFIVLSTPKQITGGYLRLVPAENNVANRKEREKFVIKLQEGQFANNYTVEQIDFTRLPDDVARLNVNTVVSFYPHVNRSTQETFGMAKLRFDAIINELSPTEFSGLQLVVSLDPEAGAEGKLYEVPGFKQPNQYIRRKKAKYVIGLKIADLETLSRINTVLQSRGLEPADNDSGIFGYIPNDSFSFTDSAGNIVDPTKMTRRQATNLIEGANNDLSLVHKNFAVNQLLVSYLDSLSIGAEPQPIDQNSLPFNMSLNVEGGVVFFDGKDKSLNDLDYKYADYQNNYLIYDLKAPNRTVETISNLEGSEKIDFADSVENKLKEQGLWNNGPLQRGKGDRYIAAVLLPNGTFALVPLKPSSLSKEGRQELAVNLIERAQLTVKENVDDKGKEKEVTYNKEYNEDLLSGLFISSKPNMDIQIQVTPWGKIQIQLYNQATQQEVAKHVIGSDVIDNKEITASQKIQTLLDSFNDDPAVKELGVKVANANFRNSFPSVTNVNEIISKTTTQVSPPVVVQQQVRLFADSAAVQAEQEKSTIIDRQVEPVADPQPSMMVAEESQESIIDLSDEEFKSLGENDYMDMNSEFIDHIVNKRVRGIDLNSREEQVEKARFSEINIKVAQKGGVASMTEQTESETVDKKDSLSQVIKQIDDLKASILEGVDPKLRAKTLRENKEYQDLLKIRKTLERKANKVLPAKLSEQDIDDIDVFMGWAEKNLPSFISVEDINTLGNNMKAGGERVGAFGLNLHQLASGMKIQGTIYTGAQNPFKYHEAFHGVYRMLLTPEEQARLQSLARKEVRAKLRAEGKSFEKELQRFKNSADTYANMSRKELEAEYYEEYMADEFQKFKKSAKDTSTNSAIKSFFTRILEWIKAFLGTYSKSELQTLFEKIDAGKFKNADIITNGFTAPLQPGLTIANALIPYSSESEGGKIGYLYLDSDIADPLVRSISAMYLNRTMNVTGPYNAKAVMDTLIEDFAWLYDPANSINADKTQKQKLRLNEIQQAFDVYEEEIKGEVIKLLNIINAQSESDEFTAEYFEDDTGLRNTSQYDMDQSLIGGFKSLSTKLRTYIATTTLEEQDYFGNTELKEGEPLIVAVNVADAYNGLLKAVKGLENPKEMLQSMYFFGEHNSQAGAVVNRILQDVGISEQELLSNASLPSRLKNAPLFQSLIKGFENFRVEYLFNERDSQGNIRIYSAAERDDINSQLDRWYQAFITKRKQLVENPTRKRQTQTLLQKLSEDIKTEKKITNVSLSNKAVSYSEQLFDLVGIKISPLYIEFSIAYNKSNKTQKQDALVSTNVEETPMQFEDIQQLDLLIQQNQNIFDTGELGMSSRLKTMAINNAPFDETIGASVFRNPNGDLVYANQLPTYHLKEIAYLNKEGINLDRIVNPAYYQYNPALENNWLLNNPAFISLAAAKQLKIVRVAGNKLSSFINNELDLSERTANVLSSSTYGDFTPQEFLISLINNYTALLNTKSNRVRTISTMNRMGMKEDVALAPSLIRVMEASNTGDMINLPVVKTVEMRGNEVVLTEEAVDAFVDRVRSEFNRIVRESNVETATGEVISGYNTKDGRAYKFHNSDMLLSARTKTVLEGIAVESGKAEEALSLEEALKQADISMTQLRKEIADRLEEQFDEFQELIDELNIRDAISNNIKDGLVVSAGVSRKNLTESATRLNLIPNEEHNLKQIFFNDYINTYAINEILLGDQAISLQGAVDQIKRAKQQNAAYYSAYSAVSAPKLGVNHPVEDISLVALEEPVGTSSFTGNNIDRADAQMYITTKAFRYMFFGFGKLSPAQANLLDQIEAGTPITSDEIFGSAENPIGIVKQDGMINSKKLVYADGDTYLKMSAFVLTPEFTSNYDAETDTWTPKPNRVALHNLRLKLEAIEDTKDTISIAAPLSAIKMKKQRINDLNQLTTAEPFKNGHTTLNARYMGLQVLNPSNKLSIIDPSQVKEIVTSEQQDDVMVFIDGQMMSIGEVREGYNNAIKKRVTLRYKNKRNLIFSLEGAMDELNAGKMTPKLAAFLEYAVNSLKAGQSSTNLLEFFSSENGEQKYNLNNPITIKKFEQLFLSYFAQGVFRERVPGIQLTLVSDFGSQVYRRVFSLDENNQPKESQIIRQKVWESLDNKPEIVQLDSLTNKNIPKEGVVIIDRLRSGVLDPTTGQRYTEMIMPAHFKSVMDFVENTNEEIPEVIEKMFGVRIPSQDNHSTINMRLVDFLPVYYGSSAMFAQELIEVSGADFDIDKIHASIKNFYVEGKKFYEYGKGRSQEERYTDYLRYVSDQVDVPGTTYNEAYNLYINKEVAAEIQNSVDDLQQEIASDAGLSENGIKALQVLGLPITSAQYGEYVAKYGEPYEAPYDNEVLDYRYALMGNRGVTEDGGVDNPTYSPISYAPANTDIIIDTLAELSSDSNYFADKVQEDNTDVDNLVGKTQAFKANKGSAIGAIVLPNLYLSLLTENKSKLNKGFEVDLNKTMYDDYGVTVDVNGQRKQDTMSALITMATDNAKDRLFSKLGLNRHALGVVANMTALGIPLKTSILLINQPIIQELYEKALNKKNPTDLGIDKLVEAEIVEMKKKSVALSGRLTDDLLLDLIDNPQNATDGDILEVLEEFENIIKIKNFTSKMGIVTSLTKQLGSSVIEVNGKLKDINEAIQLGQDKDAPIDLKPVYEDSWQGQYIELLQDLVDNVLPSVFITATPGFVSLIQQTKDNMQISDMDKTQVEQKITDDLLAYLTLTAYEYNKLNQDVGGSAQVASLSNAILYPSQYESINDIIDRMKKTDVGVDNFFLDNFVISLRAQDVDNNTGLNLANANTFRNLSSSQKVDLQNDFLKLYTSLDTKNDAQSIINYIMVKDGLQLRYQSLLDAISPFTLQSYLQHIDTVKQFFQNNLQGSDIFGKDIQELTDEFLNQYLLDINNSNNLPTYITSERKLLPKGITKNKEGVRNILEGRPRYIRIGNETLATGQIKYITYKQAEDNTQYVPVEPTGSIYQTAIGFMFGDRMTQAELRQFIKDKNQDKDRGYEDVEAEIADMALADAFSIEQAVLKNENTNIEANESSVTVQLDPEADAVNISDKAALLEQLSQNEVAMDNNEIEVNTIEDIDQSLPEQTEIEQQLTLDFNQELTEQYPLLTNFWDANIQGNKDVLAKLRENDNINDLEDFIAAYTEGTFESEESFLDQIKNCNL